MTPVRRAAWFDLSVIAALAAASAVLCLALYAVGGEAPLIAIVTLVVYLIIAIGWWLHTWSDRQGGGR